MLEFDAVILGGGSGGYAAARTLAAAGKRTAVVEAGPEIGGLCILRGCMPTKSLLYAADVLHLARKAAVWGLEVPQVGFSFERVMARKAAMVESFAAYRREQLQSGRFAFFKAAGRFTDPQTVELSSGERLRAAHFVIATGSRVAPPPFEGLKKIPYLTSDQALSLSRLPASLVVLGGGPVAVEFAQFFARFDVRVSLIQRGPRLLRDFDADAALELEKVFQREGIALYTTSKILECSESGGLKSLVFESEGVRHQVEVEEVLFALGRVPQVDGLNLEAAGVELAQGRIRTDAEMRTSTPHIFAAGDCTGPHEIVHVAIQQGEVAAHNILHPGEPRSMDYRLLTTVVFTDPQVAVVGLTEKEAQRRGIPYRVASYPFNDHGKSMLMDALDGFVKLLADPATGEILGGCCVGPMGGELIHEIIAAMHRRMTVRELAAMPHYHPTLAEIWTYPAEELS